MVFFVNYFSTLVYYLADFDYKRHRDPLASAIAYLISWRHNFVSFHHHILFYHHSVSLVVFVLIQVTILGQLFHLLGKRLCFSQFDFFLTLILKYFFWLKCVSFVLFFKVFIALLSFLIVWQFTELCKLTHLVVLLHECVQLANDATFRSVTAFDLGKHTCNGLSIFLLRKFIVIVL